MDNGVKVLLITYLMQQPLPGCRSKCAYLGKNPGRVLIQSNHEKIFSASKEAGLAQEIRETFFKHLLLYTISVA